MPEQALLEAQDFPKVLRAAQVLGLTSTAFFCGKTFAQSFTTIPALLLAPAPLLARQWRTMFAADKLLAPAIVLFSGPTFAYLAYREPQHTSSTSILYTAAAALLGACIPYTYLLIEPTNQQLEQRAAEAEAEGWVQADLDIQWRGESTHVLVDRWATLNVGRTVLAALSAGMATWAAIDVLSITGLRILTSRGE